MGPHAFTVGLCVLELLSLFVFNMDMNKCPWQLDEIVRQSKFQYFQFVDYTSVFFLKNPDFDLKLWQLID